MWNRLSVKGPGASENQKNVSTDSLQNFLLLFMFLLTTELSKAVIFRLEFSLSL